MKLIQPVEVEFTQCGWRQFAGLHLYPGARFILGVMLRYEVAAYIAAHEEQGIALDTNCQEIHYDSGLYMLLMKCQGVWYITEVWTTSAPTGSSLCTSGKRSGAVGVTSSPGCSPAGGPSRPLSIGIRR